MMAVVVVVFFPLGGFLNPSQFQSQREYEIWVCIRSVCIVQCACIYFAHSVPQFRFYFKDFVFRWCNGFASGCGFFSLDDFTVLGPNAFCWCNALYIDILRRKVISYYTSSTNQMIPIPVRFHFLRSCNCNDLSRTLYLSTYLSMFLSLPLYV